MIRETCLTHRQVLQPVCLLGALDLVPLGPEAIFVGGMMSIFRLGWMKALGNG